MLSKNLLLDEPHEKFSHYGKRLFEIILCDKFTTFIH